MDEPPKGTKSISKGWAEVQMDFNYRIQRVPAVKRQDNKYRDLLKKAKRDIPTIRLYTAGHGNEMKGEGRKGRRKKVYR